MFSAADLDEAFGIEGRVVDAFGGQATFVDVKYVAGNKLLAVGTWSAGTDADDQQDFVVARYTADGTLDTSFGGGDGIVLTDFASLRGPLTASALSLDSAAGLAILADGKFAVAGTSRLTGDDYRDTSTIAVAAYNADGSLDTTFGVGGQTTTDIPLNDVSNDLNQGERARAISVTSDGKIVVVGQAADEMEFSDIAMVRYNANGSLDTTFGGGDGTVRDSLFGDSEVTSALVQPDGKILVSGGTYDYGFGTDFTVTRFNADGSRDSTFKTGPQHVRDPDVYGRLNERAYSIALLSDGKILLGGTSIGYNFEDGSEIAGYALVRLKSDGSLDTTFGGGDGSVLTDFPDVGDTGISFGALKVLPDGKILLAGDRLARYTSAGVLDPTFDNGDGIVDGLLYQTSAIAVQPDGRFVIAGFSGPAATLARYNGDPTASGSVSGAVYNDLNSNGTRDAGEPALAGWVVYLDANDNGQVDPGEASAVSDASGNYRINRLLPGTYRVRELRQTGWTRTQPAGDYPLGYYDVTLKVNQAVFSKDFGNNFPVGNPPPLANDDTAATRHDTPVTIDVLSNDGDETGLALGTVAVKTAPKHGTIAIDSKTGKVTYSPASGFTGTDQFGYTVKDATGGASNEATVRVNVQPDVGGDQPGVDLVGEVLSKLPTSAIGGSRTPARATVRISNLGTEAIDDPVTVRLLLSTDAAPDAGDPFVASFSRRLKIAPGGFKNVRIPLKQFPADAPDGIYRLLAQVDPGDAIPESDESNNVAESATTVTLAAPFIDLSAAVASSPTRLIAGKTATLVLNLSNAGNIPARGSLAVALAARLHTTSESGDTPLTAMPVKIALKPHGHGKVKVKFTVPASLPAGAYFIGGSLDPAAALDESDVTNNMFVTASGSTVETP